MERTGPVWLARIAWLSLAVTGRTFDTALAGAAPAVRVVAVVGLFGVWATVLLALLVPGAVALTAARLLVPLAPVSALVALAGGADAAIALVTTLAGLVASVAVATAEFGESFVQASAYGSERRLPLRPPGALVPVVVVLWTVLAASAIAGPLLTADGTTVVGIVVSALAVGGGWILATRSHHLARRWLVMVPAGLVVHDGFVLADTLMMPRADVRSLLLAPADTQAADLTGGALGSAVEIGLSDTHTVVLAPDRHHPAGRALHVRSVIVSPSRPGRALQAWAAGER